MRVVSTAGHVDHGKSTLLRALTGMEPDRWEEERSRGLTIDLGFVWTELESASGPVTVAFVDVPGHERFIANMLAGAGAAPLALFVVAADDGWSAQSAEHLEILDLLDVPVVLTAITKIDLVPDGRVEEVRRQVREMSAGTVLDDAPIIPVDGVSLRGLDELRDALSRRLADAPTPPDRGRPRLWVDRSFTVRGAGTVVTGTLAGGGLAVGDPVVVVPLGRQVRIRGLQALGRDVERTAPGSRVAVNLGGIDVDEVGRGDTVLGLTDAAPRDVGAHWHVTDEFDVHLRPLPGREVGRRGAWHLHVGSAETRASIRPLLRSDIDVPGFVRLRTEMPLPLIAGDRLVVRDAGRRRTAAGGRVLDPDPRPLRGDDDRIARADELATIETASDAGEMLHALLLAAGGARRAPAALAASGVHPDTSPPPGVDRVGSHVVTSEAHRRWRHALLEAAREHERERPETTGLRRDELAGAATAAGAPSDLAGEVVDHLVSVGELVRSGSWYVTAGRADARDEVLRDRAADLLAALEEEPFSPPDLRESAARAGLTHEEVNTLVAEGAIVVCGKVAFSGRAVEEAVRRLRTLQERSGPFTTAQARETLGTSRKFVIPLLEHLDGRGVTYFDGSTRVLRGDGRTGR